MMVVGLTGGIGSGKTTVAGLFREFGIPVYIADEAGKRLLQSSPEIKREVIAIFGQGAYREELPDRKLIASKVFNDPEKLKALNAIIHPAVAADFQQWLQKQEAPYVLYEAAILFETGGYKKCDQNILVTAPKQERIKRIQERDQSSVAEIEARMDHQWDDKKKKKLSDFIIDNTDLRHTRTRVAELHEILLKSRKY